jgi:hypothetical protein
LRAARTAYRAGQDQPPADTGDDSMCWALRLQYLGSGYLNAADVLLAPGGEASLRAARDVLLAAGVEASLRVAREALCDLGRGPP